MAIMAFPLDGPQYSAADIGSFFATRTRGVFSGEQNLKVTPGGGMSVTVSAGIAWLIAGPWWGTSVLVSVPESIPIARADGSQDRQDAICLRLDKVGNRPEIVARAGTPGGADLPTIQRNGSYDEIYLASVRVRAGAIGITSADITDLRLDERYCGLMRDGVTSIPTQALLEQAQAEWNHWFTDVRQQLERDPAGYLLREIESLRQTVQSQVETIGQLTTSLNTLQNGLSNYVTKKDAASFAVVESFSGGHLVTDTYGRKG